MPGKIPERRLEEARGHFDDLKDGDSLNFGAFIQFCELMGQDPPKSDVRQWFQDLDRDDNGTLSWEECECMIGNNWKSMATRREEMKTALFELFGGDPETDINIPVEDLKKQITECGDDPMSPEQADELLADLNKDGNETVDTKEVMEFLFDMCGEDEQEGEGGEE